MSFDKFESDWKDILITVFPRISTAGTYLISELQGSAVIGVWSLTEGGPYFKAREIIHMKFQNLKIFSLQITNNYHYHT